MLDFKAIIHSHPLVFVDFYAEWCGPCKMMAPTFENLKKKLGDKIRIVKIDVDKNPKLAAKFNIRSLPTMHIYRDAANVRTIVGALNQRDLEHILSFYLK